MFEVGLSTCSKELNEELFAAYEKAGISHMEISMREAEYENLNFKQVSDWAAKHHVVLWSLHLPFSGICRIDDLNEQQTEASLAKYEKLMEQGAGIGIRNYVVHPSSEPIDPEKRHLHMANAKAGLCRLAEKARKLGVCIAVEDLPRTCLGNCSAEMKELLSADESLRVCFDTNHLLKQPIAEFVDEIGEKIVTIHASDYSFIDERHWMPGEGDIDWQEVIRKLREVGYTGPWLYELGFKAPVSIVRPRDFCCEDFALNAKELMAGQKPTTIYTEKLIK